MKHINLTISVRLLAKLKINWRCDVY